MRFHCIFMAGFNTLLKNYWIPKMGLLPQNQSCRKAGKSLVPSSGPNTGVTESVHLYVHVLLCEDTKLLTELHCRRTMPPARRQGPQAVEAAVTEQPRAARGLCSELPRGCPASPSLPRAAAQAGVQQHGAAEHISTARALLLTQQGQYLASGSAEPHGQCRGSGRR